MEESDDPRVALLGYGYWGPNLARNLHMRLGEGWVACVDPDPARRAEVARRYPWVRVLEDPAEVMADPEVEALVVASPARSHAPLVAEAVAAGKHVLVEKPPGPVHRRGGRLAEAADQAGRVLLVGHTFEYNPAVTRMRELLEAGELGDLWYLHSQRVGLGRIQSDINALWSIGPDVSITHYLVGAAPRWSGGPRRPTCTPRSRMWSSPPSATTVGSWPTCTCPGWTRPSCAAPPWSAPAMVVFDDLDSEAKLRVYDKGADPVSGGFGEFQFRLRRGDLRPRTDLTEPLALELDHFLECCRTGAPAPTAGTASAWSPPWRRPSAPWTRAGPRSTWTRPPARANREFLTNSPGALSERHPSPAA